MELKRILALVLAFTMLWTSLAIGETATPTDLLPETPAADEAPAAEETAEEAEVFVPAGFVTAKDGTYVYADEEMTEKLGHFTKDACVYAFTQAESGVKKDGTTMVAFALESAAVVGYVRTSRLIELKAMADLTDVVYKEIELTEAAFEKEPVEEEPATEQPAAEEHVAEQPAAEEQPSAEAAAAEEPTDDELMAGMPVAQAEEPAEAETEEEQLATQTDLDAAPVEKGSIFIIKDQTAAKTVKLDWLPLEGAKSYLVTYTAPNGLAMKRKTTKPTMTITSLK